MLWALQLTPPLPIHAQVLWLQGLSFRASAAAVAPVYDGRAGDREIKIETGVEETDPVTGKLLDVQPEGAASSRESHTCLRAGQQLRTPNIYAPACRVA